MVNWLFAWWHFKSVQNFRTRKRNPSNKYIFPKYFYLICNHLFCWLGYVAYCSLAFQFYFILNADGFTSKCSQMFKCTYFWSQSTLYKLDTLTVSAQHWIHIYLAWVRTQRVSPCCPESPWRLFRVSTCERQVSQSTCTKCFNYCCK